MTGGAFKYLHSSGRFSRSPASVEGDLNVWDANHDISLATFTEFKSNKRVDVLRKHPGWSVYNGVERPGGDECAIAWRTDSWLLMKIDSAVVSTKKSYRTNGSLIPHQYVTTVLLKNKATGNTLLVSVSHLSSHVEVPGGLRNSLRSAVWRDSTKNWHQHLRALRQEWKPTARLVVADWNVNLRASWFRNFLGNLFPALRPLWQRPYPHHGTLGNRIIDVPLISRHLKVDRKPHLLKRHRSSDHTPFISTLSWR